MSNTDTRNAMIKSTMLGREDNGIMSIGFIFDFGKTHEITTKTHCMVFPWYTSKGIDLINKIIYVVGVRNWEDVKGKYVRIRESEAGGYEIGNIVEDKWINVNAFLNGMDQEVECDEGKRG